MNDINIHGRHPSDLPDKETIKDILLELKDTRNFDISWIELSSTTRMDWRANNKSFNQFVEKGEVKTCEMDYSSRCMIQEEVSEFTTQYISVKETRYDIFRHPIRLDIRFKPSSLSLNREADFIIETSKDVYLRLKDYLGPDVIQDQFSVSDFMIDFMLTSCKVL